MSKGEDQLQDAKTASPFGDRLDRLVGILNLFSHSAVIFLVISANVADPDLWGMCVSDKT